MWTAKHNLVHQHLLDTLQILEDQFRRRICKWCKMTTLSPTPKKNRQIIQMGCNCSLVFLKLHLLHSEPRTYFAVPPFGCCFRRCCTPHHLSAKQLLWVSYLVKQCPGDDVCRNITTSMDWLGKEKGPEKKKIVMIHLFLWWRGNIFHDIGHSMQIGRNIFSPFFQENLCWLIIYSNYRLVLFISTLCGVW